MKAQVIITDWSKADEPKYLFSATIRWGGVFPSGHFYHTPFSENRKDCLVTVRKFLKKMGLEEDKDAD